MDQPGWVVVFGKPPVAGRAKTRLGATIGGAAAAEVARALLVDTFAAVARLELPMALATTDPGADHGLLPGSVQPWDQGGGDLGARVERMLREALERGRFGLALGADAPHIPVAHLQQAVEAMEQADAAIGRAADGGFWGLALRRCPAGLLTDLPWSQPTTYVATRNRLRAQGLRVVELPPWWDVDEEADLRRLVATHAAAAPATAAVAGRVLA